METKLTTLPADFTTVVDTQKTEDTRVIDGIGSETWSAEPVKTLGAKVDDELVSAKDHKNRQTLCDVRHNNNTPDVAHDTSYLHDHQSADSDLNEETRRETSTAICGQYAIFLLLMRPYAYTGVWRYCMRIVP